MLLAQKEVTLLQQLALWLLPGNLGRRLVKLHGAHPNSLPLSALTAAQALQLVAQSSAFKIPVRQLAELALHDPWRLPYALALEQHLTWAQAPNNHFVFLADLPNVLQEIPDPPVLLGVQGKLQELAAPSLAVVGSRRLSPEGENLAFNWAQYLAWQGVNIVSGLARGVDAQAHWGALQAQQAGAPATTCAVLGHGLDSIYPPEHNNLASQIVTQGGALISEYPLGHKPLPRNFPARNRLVTGLSLGVLVVEATLKSGSLVSARLAMEQGREVMAIPGSVRRKQSEGCHQLIRQGAALVTSPEEVLAELKMPLQALLQPVKSTVLDTAPVAPHLQALYNLVHDAPQTTDELLQHLQLNADQGLALLLELELEGLITQLHGGWVLSSR